MSNEELINQIVEFYSIARIASVEHRSPNIKRGRNHQVAALTEDLMAYFINLRCELSDHEILVDYPISFHSDTKKTKNGIARAATTYPDICLVKSTSAGREIIDTIDVKMDLGWNRDFSGYLEAAGKATAYLRSIQTGWFKPLNEDGRKTDAVPVSFSQNLKRRIIVISDLNNTTEKSEANKSMSFNNQYSSYLKYYVFTTGQHPNGGKPKINDHEIDQFINDTISICK